MLSSMIHQRRYLTLLLLLFAFLLSVGVLEAQPRRRTDTTRSDSDSESKPENLGPAINSSSQEVAPIISYDGRTLYFHRFYHPGNVGGTDDAEDIWYSTLGSDGRWKPAVNLGAPLNNTSANFISGVTPDGNTLLVGNIYYKDGGFNRGISMSHRTRTGWSFPDSLRIDGYVDLGRWRYFSLSPDGQTMIIEVVAYDTRGEDDLYVSFRQPDGSWSRPLNLGADINTAGSEITPFLAGDGRTLYFSTNGRGGYGDMDVFVTRRLDDSWTSWSKPENLGPSINSRGWDTYYTVPASGEYAYYVSNTNSLGQEDIFRIKLPPEARPKPVALIRGRVLDARTRKPIGTAVYYETLPNGKRVGFAQSDTVAGNYQIILPTGSLYGFRAEAPGYIPVNDNLDTRKLTEYTELERDLLLVPIAKGESVRLNNIFFDTGKWDLRDESRPELDRLATFLRDNPETRVEIGGHTDNVGTQQSNQTLSQNRAQAVVDYLRSVGINQTRLVARGYGQLKPVAANSNDDGRQQNRRVEFTILNLQQ